jgi:hypothetical protein
MRRIRLDTQLPHVREPHVMVASLPYLLIIIIIIYLLI